MLPSDDQWELVPLVDVLEFREGPGIMARDFREDGVPLVRLAGLREPGALLTGCNYLDPEMVKKRWDHFRLREGDVLLSTSASLGEVAVVDASGVGAIAYTGIIGFRPKGGRVIPAFIPHALTAPSFTRQIEAMGAGSVLRHFGPLHLRQMSLRVPPVHVQRAISEVLEALDDKIESNARMLGILDALVRAEVASAQANAGREASLGELVERITEIAKTDELDETTHYVGLEHMARGSVFLSAWGSAEALASSKSRFQAGDILFGKLRPYFRKVAVAPAPGVCSTDVLVLRPKLSGQAAFASVACASNEVIDYASAGSEGTRMPRVSWDYLSRFLVRMPTVAAMEVLDRRISPQLQLGARLPWHSAALARLRDTLLPELLSGEIRVREAESLVWEAN